MLLLVDVPFQFFSPLDFRDFDLPARGGENGGAGRLDLVPFVEVVGAMIWRCRVFVCEGWTR